MGPSLHRTSFGRICTQYIVMKTAVERVRSLTPRVYFWNRPPQNAGSKWLGFCISCHPSVKAITMIEDKKYKLKTT